MTCRVYVAAPYEDAEQVRGIHKLLREAGLEMTSRWAEQATGAEDFSTFKPWELACLARANDADLLSSHAVLVMARKGAGGEMFAEARIAIHVGIPVFWFGRKTLSAWRPGVTQCESLDDVIGRLSRFAWDHSAKR